jgi:hypothetical protein
MPVTRWNSPWATLALTALLYCGFLGALLYARGGDVTAMVMAGKPVINRDSLPPGFAIIPDQAGYDGQYYYRLARTPFTNQRVELGIVLDLPAYRQQRILYPLLARAVALGNTAALPPALLLVNLAALCLLGWIGGLYARELGVHALWGLVFPLYIGFVTTLSRDLAEIVECTLILGALLCLRRGRFLVTGLLLSGAVLTKEPALLVPAGIGLADLIGDRRRLLQHTWYVVALPLTTWLAWQGWLWRNWHTFPMHQGGQNLGWPLADFGRTVTGALRVWHWPWVVAFVLLAVLAVSVAASLRTSRAERWEKWAWALYALMVFSLSGTVWQDSHAFVRAASELTMLGSLILLGAEGRWRKGVLVLGVLCWLGAAAQVGLKP